MIFFFSLFKTTVTYMTVSVCVRQGNKALGPFHTVLQVKIIKYVKMHVLKHASFGNIHINIIHIIADSCPCSS